MRSNRPASNGGYKAVFFDLDGTLVDTAPDMVAILSKMQDARQQPRLPYDTARNSVSNGAISLLRLSLNESLEIVWNRSSNLRLSTVSYPATVTQLPTLLTG